MTTCRATLLNVLFLFWAATTASAVEWSYDGARGPDHWAELSGSFTTCAKGSFQSPFNLVSDIDAGLDSLDIHYAPQTAAITNTGHTLEVAGSPHDELRIGDQVYRLLQFQFHSPSEHMIDGHSFPMELHFVHQATDGRMAVLGVMIAEGNANPAITALWNVATYGRGTTGRDDAMIDPVDLLPADLSYFRFMGSLTMPPCTEGIHWHMLKTPITASADQIAAFRTVFANNARPIQPRNGRLVVRGR